MGAGASRALAVGPTSPSLLSSSLYLWVRFWVFATGLGGHEALLRRLAVQLRDRPAPGAVQRPAFYHGLGLTLAELWLRTLRVVLVPDVFARYLCATFLLHVFYEASAAARGAILNVFMRLTTRGRRTLRLRSQMEGAGTFQERQAIAGELDKIESNDKWRDDPASGLFLYERVMNKTQMYKVRYAW